MLRTRTGLPWKTRACPTCLAAALFLLCASLEASVVSYTRDANLVRFRLSGGRAEIEWVSDSSFRYATGGAPVSRPFTLNPVSYTVADLGPTLEIKTRYVTVGVLKEQFRLTVRTAKGDLLMEETAAPERTEDGFRIERAIAEGERLFGFGPRTDTALDARGLSILSSRPYFYSTRDYGQYHASPKVLFDAGKTAPGRLRITSPGDRLEYYFYHGGTPKEILEEHSRAVPPSIDYRPTDFEILPASQMPSYATPLPKRASLAEIVRAMVHGGLSGVAAPALDVDAFPANPRAQALASVVPIVTGKGRTSPLRESLLHYFVAYVQEARDRAFPMIHSLPFQFPSDAETQRYSDEFMLGDELLVAPFLDESASRRAYLPMGWWTDLTTNERHKGRQVIEVGPKSGPIPLFAKNGSIVPLNGLKEGDPLSLHYFPALGAEFFLWEIHHADISQFHASPSAGYFRLEIETKEPRLYEWVIHHVGSDVASVAEGAKAYREVANRAGLENGCWHLDRATGNLHVRLEARAGEDRIVNVKLSTPVVGP